MGSNPASLTGASGLTSLEPVARRFSGTGFEAPPLHYRSQTGFAMIGVVERGRSDWLSSGVTGALLLLVLVGGLITYKSSSALRQIERARTAGSIATRTDVVPTSATPSLSVTARSGNYLAVIWPALLFGLLISAGVRAFVPGAAWSRLFGRGAARGQLIAGASGAPLMLCSCCVTPVFSSVYQRSSRLAPSLAMMLAAPALNPAALVLTFLLFSSEIAWSRFVMSIVAVFIGTAVVARLAGSPRAEAAVAASAFDAPPESGLMMRYVQSLAHVTIRTVPLIVIGVVLAMLVSEYIPAWVRSPVGSGPAIAIAASLAVPLALPTFFEIPIAVTLLAAGAPAGAAAAVLFAGPAVNLASLLTVGQVAGWRTMVLVASMIWLVAVAGGIAIG